VNGGHLEHAGGGLIMRGRVNAAVMDMSRPATSTLDECTLSGVQGNEASPPRVGHHHRRTEGRW